MSNVIHLDQSPQLRRIEPFSNWLRQEAPNLGRRPELRWVPPTSLLVDETYQRDLGRRSLRLINSLIENFAWRKMKPPVVVEVGTGLHCIDGQHTAIAAATLKIKDIPVFVVEAGTVAERAEAFVSHNKDRIVLDPFGVYRGRLASGDPTAVAAQRVCQQAGIRMRQTNAAGKILIGDTACVGTVCNLVQRRGYDRSVKILRTLVLGERAGIAPAEINAVENLMLNVRPEVTVEQMARVIKVLGQRGVLESRLRATTEIIPQKHALLEMYLKLLDKQTVSHACSA